MKKTLLSLALLSITACTRIETGHVGVRVSMNGEIQSQELGVGFHQTIIGSVRQFVANEMTIELNDLHPQTKDRTTLADLDLTFTYSINPGVIADLVVKYKGRDLETPHNGIYPLGLYISNVVQTASTDVFSHYDALSANENREKIRDEIRTQIDKILKEDNLNDKIKIHQIFIKNLQLAKELQQSALNVITSQNELKAKEYEVQTAKREAERLSLLAQNKSNIDYMNAKSTSDIAEAVKNGKVNTIVIPYDFRGIINVPTGK